MIHLLPRKMLTAMETDMGNVSKEAEAWLNTNKLNKIKTTLNISISSIMQESNNSNFSEDRKLKDFYFGTLCIVRSWIFHMEFCNLVLQDE